MEASPWALKESAASARSGVGQAALAQRQWEAAEEPLSEVALKFLQLCTCLMSAHACSETLANYHMVSMANSWLVHRCHSIAYRSLQCHSDLEVIVQILLAMKLPAAH